MPKYPNVSSSVTRRLPRYYRFLCKLANEGVERISSREFADITGLTASQIRQDLNCFGGFGQQGYGYNVSALYTEIGRILSLDKKLPAILVGAGNLGLAIAKHINFEAKGFSLIGIFDKNPKIVGKQVCDWQVRDIKTLEAFCSENKPKVAVLCIPAPGAMELADDLVRWGITGFWNFSHYDLALAFKDKVAVENMHLGDSLMTLCYYANEMLE